METRTADAAAEIFTMTTDVATNAINVNIDADDYDDETPCERCKCSRAARKTGPGNPLNNSISNIRPSIPFLFLLLSQKIFAVKSGTKNCASSFVTIKKCPMNSSDGQKPKRVIHVVV